MSDAPLPDALTPRERTKLRESRACIVGCGGLGGYLVELLARAGVGALRVVDGDVFERGNLDRQLLCCESLIGQSKAEAARARVAAIRDDVTVEAMDEPLTEANALSLVADCHIALDALDSVPARRLLAEACAQVGIPLVHAAIGGWRAQVALVPPGSGLLERVYPPGSAPRQERTLSFVPAFAASVQAAEAVKALAGLEPTLAERLLLVDLRALRCQTVDLR